MTEDRRAQRADMRAALERDASRHARREKGHRSFWRALSVLGMVGWPIALGSVGGALLGYYFDRRGDTGVRFTLMLLMIGTALGSFVAWKTINQ